MEVNFVVFEWRNIGRPVRRILPLSWCRESLISVGWFIRNRTDDDNENNDS